jgi:hypothetical protein
VGSQSEHHCGLDVTQDGLLGLDPRGYPEVLIHPCSQPSVAGWVEREVGAAMGLAGMERRISDRFDLTLEAIRLFYEGVAHRNENPFGAVPEACGRWFALLGESTEGLWPSPTSSTSGLCSTSMVE